MGQLPDYKDIVELFKQGLTLEAQEKIMELRVGALPLQEENLALREQVKALEDTLAVSQNMTFRESVYWQEGDANPFCPRCWEDERKAIHLQGDDVREFPNCPVCNYVRSTVRP